KRRPIRLKPLLFRPEKSPLKYGSRITVFWPVSEPLPGFQHKNFCTRCGKTGGGCSTADPRSDNDNIRLSSQSRHSYLACGIHQALRAPRCMFSVLVSV